MRALGGFLWFVGGIIGLLWWIAGFITYVNTYEGLVQFAGVFFIPNLALPLLGAPDVTYIYWLWGLAAVVLSGLGSFFLWGEEGR